MGVDLRALLEAANKVCDEANEVLWDEHGCREFGWPSFYDAIHALDSARAAAVNSLPHLLDVVEAAREAVIAYDDKLGATWRNSCEELRAALSALDEQEPR